MTKRIFLPLFSALILPHGLHAAGSAATEKEYQQVRTIALRDARVQAAYRDADRRLDAKIIQIDPALESYVKRKQQQREGVAVSKEPKVTPKAAAKPAPSATPKKMAVKSTATKSTHTVAGGETLGGIAARHHVSVSALKNANHISDERKLRVGQVLTIPAGKGAPAAKKDESFWSRLMH